MKEKQNKNIEQYVRAVVKETPLESPSHDFTAKVMTGVLAMGKDKATVYKPLISGTGWILIFGGIIGTIVYFIVNGGTQNVSLPGPLGNGVKDFIKPFGNLHVFQFSGTTITIIAVSTILMFIQITLLKNYLNKRLAK